MTRGLAAAFGRLATGGGGMPSNFHQQRWHGLLGWRCRRRWRQQSVNFRAGKIQVFFGKKFLGFCRFFKNFSIQIRQDTKFRARKNIP